MKKAGQEQIVDSSLLSVMGFWEVAKRYFFFRRLMHDTIDHIKRKRPSAVVLVDYPGFNLRLAQKVKLLGIPIIYYISPQIWAWGGNRIHQIKQLVDLMLLILPFETEIYDKAGVRNKFVGHYLLDDIRDEFIKAPYDYKSNLIALLPGSRPQEVDRMLPTLLASAKLLNSNGEYRFAVAGVEGNIDYSSYLDKCPVNAELIQGKTRELIMDSRLVITSSGTATLETGIIGRPMIVIYKTGGITYRIARRLVKLDKIALINISADKKIVPELIQSEANPRNIAQSAQSILENREKTDQIIRDLNSTADKLGGAGGSKAAAEAIMELVN